MGSVESFWCHIWLYSILYLLLNFTVAPKVHSLFPTWTQGGEGLGALGITCSLELERGKDIAATVGMYWGVTGAVGTCWMMLQYESGREFSQRERPHLVGP